MAKFGELNPWQHPAAGARRQKNLKPKSQSLRDKLLNLGYAVPINATDDELKQLLKRKSVKEVKGHPKGEDHRWVPLGNNPIRGWQCHCGAFQKKKPEPRGTYDIRTGKYVRKWTEEKATWNTYARRSLTEGEWNTYQKTAPIIAKQMKKPFRVTTKEGPVSGKAGDYLCLGVENETWPVDKDIFEKTMKKVADGPHRSLKEAQDLSTDNLTAKTTDELTLLKLRLFGKALKTMPSSPRQKEVHKELMKVHTELKRRGIKEIIKKHGDGYRLVSHKGKNLGDFSSKAAAEKHEREVQYFKSKGK